MVVKYQRSMKMIQVHLVIMMKLLISLTMSKMIEKLGNLI
jgi:hypothetical protein